MAEHRNAAEAVLAQRGDRVVCVNGFVKGKVQQVIAFGAHGRVYVMTPKKGGVNVDFHSHILDLRKVKSSAPNKFSAVFGNGSIEADFECTEFINEMRQMYHSTFGSDMFPCEVEPDSRLRDLEDPPERPCGGYTEAYICVCDWQNVTPRSDVIWEIDNVYVATKRRSLGLEEVENLKPQEFVSLVSTLSYNKYFTALTFPNIPLDKTMAQAVGVMIAKNTTIEEINMSNSGLVKGNIAPIAWNTCGMSS